MSEIRNALVLPAPTIQPVSATAKSNRLRFERRNSRVRRLQLESQLTTSTSTRLGRILDIRV